MTEDVPTVAPTPAETPICSDCRRPRGLHDWYDYNPLQLVTGQPLGWFNNEGEQMCGECLAATMRGERP